jgi:hypothetical protein
MAKSETLFLLIKSLNQAEKRYIKLFSNKSGTENKKYMQLFKAFVKHAKSDVYDEELVEKELEGVIAKKNFSYEKNYLYQFILKSLRNFHGQNTPRIQLQELMINISLLYERGLLKETLQLISKAKKIAEKYDYDLQFLEILLLERRITRQFKRKETKASITQIQNESQKKLDRVNQQLKILDCYEDVFLEAKNFGASKIIDEDLQIKIQRILPLKIDSMDTSLEMKLYYHLTHSMYHYISRDWKTRAEHLKAVLDYFEQNSFLLNDTQYQERYLSFLNNYINYCYAFGEEEELKEQIKVLENWKAKSRALNIQLEQYRFYGKMLYAFKRKRFDEMVEMSSSLDELLKKFEANLTLNRRLTFLFHMAAAFLLENKFDEAETKVNEIINQPKFENRTDIQILARIMRIILFFEKGILTLAEYETTSATRYLKKSRNDNPTEKKILSFLRKLVSSPTPKVILNDFHDFLKDKKGYEEIFYWVERKLN